MFRTTNWTSSGWLVEASWNVMAHKQKSDFVCRAKRTSPFKSAVASVQSTAGSRGVRISGSSVGYTMFRGSVKGTGYPLHSPVHLNRPVGRQFSRLLAAEVCGISGSNAGYTMFRGSVEGTGYPLHSPVSSSFPLPWVTVCHYVSTGVYTLITSLRYGSSTYKYLPAGNSVVTSSKVDFLLNLNQIISTDCLSRHEFWCTSMDSHKKNRNKNWFTSN